MTFATHNLTTDHSLGEMNLIMCRNVLIYFDRELKNRVLTMFTESLCHPGFLCLGMEESLQFSDVNDQFESVGQNEKVFQRI